LRDGKGKVKEEKRREVHGGKKVKYKSEEGKRRKDSRGRREIWDGR
jgi:hypothetical protein